MVQDSLTPYIYKKTVVLKTDDTVQAAAKAMAENDIGSVLVSGNQGNVVGVLTDRDLVCRLLANGALEEDVRLDEVMTPEPIAVDQMSSVYDVVELMKKHGIRRVPVCQAGKTAPHWERCLGIVTLDDLVATKAVDLDDLCDIVKSQVQIRPRGVPNRMRSMARMTHTEQQFLKALSQELEMSVAGAKKLLLFVLGTVVKRLQFSAAKRLLSPFPQLLKSELEVMMVGPDKAISSETLISGVMARFNREREEATQLLGRFWSCLGRLAGENVLANASAKLPKDMAKLLAGKKDKSPTHISTFDPDEVREQVQDEQAEKERRQERQRRGPRPSSNYATDTYPNRFSTKNYSGPRPS